MSKPNISRIFCQLAILTHFKQTNKTYCTLQDKQHVLNNYLPSITTMGKKTLYLSQLLSRKGSVSRSDLACIQMQALHSQSRDNDRRTARGTQTMCNQLFEERCSNCQTLNQLISSFTRTSEVCNSIVVRKHPSKPQLSVHWLEFILYGLLGYVKHVRQAIVHDYFFFITDFYNEIIIY